MNRLFLALVILLSGGVLVAPNSIFAQEVIPAELVGTWVREEGEQEDGETSRYMVTIFPDGVIYMYIETNIFNENGLLCEKEKTGIAGMAQVDGATLTAIGNQGVPIRDELCDPNSSRLLNEETELNAELFSINWEVEQSEQDGRLLSLEGVVYQLDNPSAEEGTTEHPEGWDEDNQNAVPEVIHGTNWGVTIQDAATVLDFDEQGGYSLTIATDTTPSTTQQSEGQAEFDGILLTRTDSSVTLNDEPRPSGTHYEIFWFVYNPLDDTTTMYLDGVAYQTATASG
jgi:hypothetical protein